MVTSSDTIPIHRASITMPAHLSRTKIRSNGYHPQFQKNRLSRNENERIQPHYSILKKKSVVSSKIVCVPPSMAPKI